jgi:hypothetical protein
VKNPSCMFCSSPGAGLDWRGGCVFVSFVTSPKVESGCEINALDL